MSAEQNVPEVQSHQGPPPPPDQQDAQQDQSFSGTSVPHGMGQSKSSRRRRRKRKNKGPETAAGADSPRYQAESGALPSVQASAAPSQGNPVAQSAGQPQNQGGHNQGPGTAKRWKKKFRDRERPRRDDSSQNPGNQGSSNNTGTFASSNGGGNPNPGTRDTHQFGNRVDGWKSRKGGGGGGKQQRDRGPRSFVGPMDHSYRVVNGNFADTPPSTIETHGNGNHGGGRPRSYHSSNDSQPIDYSQGRVVPIAEDAPTKIYFFIDDLFFIAKIQETARKLGVKVAFVKNEKEELAKLTGGEEVDRPGLIVFDLNNANAKPLTLIPKLKAKLKRSTSIVGFLSHLQGDLKAKAVEAGCDTVMPRAAFSQNLPNLLRRYGLQEEKEEANYNQ